MKRKPSELALAAVSLVCVLILAACNCAPTLRYITVSPLNPTITAGTTQQFTATGFYSNGTVTPGLSVSWSSSNTSVATINGTSGVATGVANGTTTITATALGITSASTTLTVNGITSITVTPADPSIGVGQTQAFKATSNGGTDVTSLVTWSSVTTSVATITTAGVATGVSAGTSSISAALNGITGSTTLTVTPPVPLSLVITPAAPNIAIGNAILLTAQEKLSDGSTRTPLGTVTWVSSTPAQANVVSNSASTALAAGFAAGAPTITATEGTLTSPATTLTVVVGKTHFAYVSNAGNLNLGAYSVNATASPYLTSTGTAGTPGYLPSQTVLNPNGMYLYSIATNGTNSYVFEFTINATTGALTSAGSTLTVAGESGQNTGVIDPYGRFLYVIDDGSNSTTYPNGTIYGFTISQTDGSLTPIGAVTAYTTNLNVPEGIVADKTGNYLYVSNNSGNNISIYSINQTTGALTPVGTPVTTGSTASSGPWFVTVDPAGADLYVANNSEGSVTSFSIGSGGTLTSPTTVNVTSATAVLNLIISPNDKYLYVLDEGSPSGNGQVYLFTLTSGVPSSAPVGSPVAVGQNPTGMAIDPTSTLLAVDNSGNHTTAGSISLFTIGSTGALTSQTAVAAGIQPYFVTFYDAP